MNSHHPSYLVALSHSIDVTESGSMGRADGFGLQTLLNRHLLTSLAAGSTSAIAIFGKRYRTPKLIYA
jgi:hypothetical protein